MRDRSKFAQLDTPPVHPFHKKRPCLGQETHIFVQPVKETGLLIFCAVADPRNSGISAKSREIPKKRERPRNPLEIFPNTCRQNIFNTYLGY